MASLLLYSSLFEQRRSIQKIVVSEIAASVILLTSTIELVAFAAISLLLLPSCLIDSKPCKMFIKYTLASGISVIGSLAFIIINPLTPSISRYLTRQLRPRIAPGSTQFDTPLDPSLPQAQGSSLITHMLQNVHPIITKAFEEQNPSIYLFLVRKAVYLYTLGPRKQEPIPTFFKPDVIQDIRNLRSKYETDSPNNSCIALLNALIHDNAQFNTDPPYSTALSHDQNTNDETLAKTLFQELCDVSAKELQGGIFVTQCCQDAYNNAYPQR